MLLDALCLSPSLSEVKSEDIQLIDAGRLGVFAWPDSVDGDYARRFLEPFLLNGTNHYIDNIDADVFVLKYKSFVFPIVAVHENYHNSYVCSPYGHFISYGIEHIDLVTNPFVRKTFKYLLNGLGKLVKAGRINSVVYVNNWLFALDLYPQGVGREDIAQMTEFLAKRFPDSAIIFRSLNGMTNASLMQALKQEGFIFIPSRYVHLTDTTQAAIFQTRILKSDLKFLSESSFELLDEKDISPDECPKLLSLYHLFYIAQHSPLNPQFNQRFIYLMYEQGLLRFKVVKIKGEIKGVAGYFERGGVMYCPMLGYDKNDPEHKQIYRYLSTALLLEAKKNGWIFNQSAGASFYKQIRRAEGYMEYMGIYTAHLPYKQSLSWASLRTLISLGSTFIKNY